MGDNSCIICCGNRTRCIERRLYDFRGIWRGERILLDLSYGVYEVHIYVGRRGQTWGIWRGGRVLRDLNRETYKLHSCMLRCDRTCGDERGFL